MIPLNVITAWGVHRPWPTLEQVEQDLLLARAICEIATDDYLGDELAYRVGTRASFEDQDRGQHL